jgi:hypothetical protein
MAACGDRGHCHHDSHKQLETHLADFIAAAYNFARRLKTIHGPRLSIG